VQRKENPLSVSRIAVLWPDAANYDRFREISEGDIKAATVEEYYAAVGPNLDHKAASGIHVERVAFDPEELLAYAKSVGRRVDSQSRSAFAAMLDHRKNA